MDQRPPRTPLPPPPTRASQAGVPVSQGTGTQMSPQVPGYGPPSPAIGYGPPSVNPAVGYGPPPTVQGYGAPPTPFGPAATGASGYGAPPSTMPGYGPAPVTGYGPPPTAGYAVPHGYGPPPTMAQPPMPQNAYAPPGSVPPAGHPVPNANPHTGPGNPTYGSLPPLGWQAGQTAYGALPLPPEKKGPPVALIAGGAAAAAVVVLGLIGGAYALFRTNHKPLPVDAAKLPSDTDFFQEDRFPGADGAPAVREAFLASDLARHVCGAGSDFAERLLALKSNKSANNTTPPLDALTLFDPKTLEGRRASLECGQSLVKSLETPNFTELVFRDGDDKNFLSVKMLKLNVDELPAKHGFARQSFAGSPGYCLVSPKKTEPDFKWAAGLNGAGTSGLGGARKDVKDGECTDSSLAAFHDGPTWFFGTKTSIDAFARSYAKPKKELSTTVENLQLAFDSGEGLAMRRADARPKASSSLLKLPCSLAGFDSGAGSKFMEECLPKSVEKNASGIDSKVRAVTYEVASPIHEADGIRFNLFFVARDNDAAKDVESELKEATRDWKDAVENNESKLSKLVREAPRQLGQRKWAVAIDPFLRSIRGAKVARNGRVVELRLAEKYSSSEKKELDEVMGKTTEDAQAVAAITQALVKGQPVPEASLAELVGADWAAHVLAARATEKECTAFRDKMGRFDMTNPMAIPTSLRFALRFKCEGQPLPRVTQKCLSEATDAVTFGKCPMPSDPLAFGKPTALDLELKSPSSAKTIIQ